MRSPLATEVTLSTLSSLLFGDRSLRLPKPQHKTIAGPAPFSGCVRRIVPIACRQG
jgi:hypothetical protein